jgi:hypothetical protein
LFTLLLQAFLLSYYAVDCITSTALEKLGGELRDYQNMP